MNDAKYIFATTEWLAMLRGVFEQTVAGGSHADDTDFAMCEVYTDVPAHVSSAPRLSWHIRLSDGEVSFATEEIDDVDIKIVAEWALLSELSAVEYGADGPPPDLIAKVAQAANEGRFQFIQRPAMKPPPPAFGGVHNQVARRTLR